MLISKATGWTDPIFWIVRAQGFRADVGGDHERGEGVAALVEADRLEAGPQPRGVRALADVRGRERRRIARAEDEADVSA